jgi:hypothetical protein
MRWRASLVAAVILALWSVAPEADRPAAPPLLTQAEADEAGSRAYGQYAAARAVATDRSCARVQRHSIPADHRPSTAQRRALSGCSSSALYYGIGQAVDYEGARHCAIIEREMDFEEYNDHYTPLRGDAILVMLYANGLGVERAPDIAIASACAMGGEAAHDIWDRVSALELMRADSQPRDSIDYCDHAGSSLASIVCVGRDSDLNEQRRAQLMAALATGREPAFGQRLDASYQALGDYLAIAHSMNCFRGSLAAACSEGAQDHDSNRFVALLEELAGGPSAKRTGAAMAAIRPAQMSPAAWEAFLVDQEVDDDRDWYQSLRPDAVAARRRFERALIAFTRRAFPERSNHDIRVMFADI